MFKNWVVTVENDKLFDLLIDCSMAIKELKNNHTVVFDRFFFVNNVGKN